MSRYVHYVFKQGDKEYCTDDGVNEFNLEGFPIPPIGSDVCVEWDGEIIEGVLQKIHWHISMYESGELLYVTLTLKPHASPKKRGKK